MTERKLADFCKGEPIPWRAPDGTVLFSVPRGIRHLTGTERSEYLKIAMASARADKAVNAHFQKMVTESEFSDEGESKRKELLHAQTEANFAIAKFIAPDLTRKAFDAFPGGVLPQMIEDFNSDPFGTPTAKNDPKPTVGPETSV
jgi:hypothetical protein